MNFEKIAPYLNDPLVLIGFVLFLVFSFCRYLVKYRVIPELPSKLGFVILKQILLYGFLIGLLVIGLGFGLKYKELSRIEQKNALRMLNTELKQNLSTVNDLRKNTIHIIQKQQVVAQILRKDGIEIFTVLFPQNNISSTPSITAQEMANSAFESLVSTGLIKDELQLNRFNEAGSAVNSTIAATLSVLKSLQDESGERYTISREIWESNLSIYRKVSEFDANLFKQSLSELERLRTNYNVTVGHAIEYLDAVRDFFSPGRTITKDNLYNLLFKERVSFSISIDYSKSLIKNVEQIKKLEEEINKKRGSK